MPRFKRMVMLAVIVAGAAAGGVYWYKSRSQPAGLVPPEAKGNLEPDVLYLIQTGRERVLREPTSANAWGLLGQQFLANDFEEEGLICFVEAERLDPGDPRWPYYQGKVLVNRGEFDAAVPFL